MTQNTYPLGYLKNLLPCDLVAKWEANHLTLRTWTSRILINKYNITQKRNPIPQAGIKAEIQINI